MNNISLFFSIFFSKRVASLAIKIALIVGIILALINHGNVIFSGETTTLTYIKIIVTFFVPYTVSSTTATILQLKNSKI